MSKRKVINSKQLPAKLPVVGTVLWLVVLDGYDAPGWAWGCSITILVIVWLVVVWALFTQEVVEVDL